MTEVKGNGTIVRTVRQVSSFVRLHLSVRGRVELVQSDEEKVEIETDENLHDFFEIANSGRTLYITSEARLRRPIFSQLVIRVYIRQMGTLYHAGEGDVVTSGPLSLGFPLDIKVYAEGNTDLELHVPSINLKAACEGNITLRGSCNELNIKVSSEGNLDCREMMAKNVSIRNTSEGNITLYAQESISIRHMGEGNIHYYGPGVLRDVRHHGEGDVRHMG